MMMLSQRSLTFVALLFALASAHDEANPLKEFANHDHATQHAHQHQDPNAAPVQNPARKPFRYVAVKNDGPHDESTHVNHQKVPHGDHTHDIHIHRIEVDAQEDQQLEQETQETEAKGHFHDHLSEMKYLDRNKMSENEQQYHFFRAHDYDNDTELDGVEIMQSLHHAEEVKIFTDEEISEKIDYLLKNFDSNKNGKLSFPEFMMSTARFMEES